METLKKKTEQTKPIKSGKTKDRKTKQNLTKHASTEANILKCYVPFWC